MQPRNERQKILWAIFLSLLLHLVVGVCIASFGDKLQPRLPEEEKPMVLTIVDIAPASSPIIHQKNKHSSPMLTRLAPASCLPWESRPSQHSREKSCRHTIWRVTHIRWINRALNRSSIRAPFRSPAR